MTGVRQHTGTPKRLTTAELWAMTNDEQRDALRQRNGLSPIPPTADQAWPEDRYLTDAGLRELEESIRADQRAMFPPAHVRVGRWFRSLIGG
jgi:hypothetical protein